MKVSVEISDQELKDVSRMNAVRAKHLLTLVSTLLIASILCGCITRIRPRSPSFLRHVQANHNDPATVSDEVNTPAFRAAVARAASIAKWRISDLRITFPSSYSLRYDLSREVNPDVDQVITDYVDCRAEGHSAEYCSEQLQRAAKPGQTTLPDPELQILANHDPDLLTSWLRKGETGARTNKAGQVVSIRTEVQEVDGQSVTNTFTRVPSADEVCRWFTFELLDGEIGWHYFVQLMADGSLDRVNCTTYDAKDLDPRYREVMEAVEREVEAEMKRDGSLDQFGAVHGYWGLKKAKLRSRGLEWRSPSDLNPNTCYD